MSQGVSESCNHVTIQHHVFVLSYEILNFFTTLLEKINAVFIQVSTGHICGHIFTLTTSFVL